MQKDQQTNSVPVTDTGLQVLVPAGWRTMESAPRDGRDILMFRPQPKPGYAVVWFYPAGGYWVSGPESFASERYTHWMPLPPAPDASPPVATVQEGEKVAELTDARIEEMAGRYLSSLDRGANVFARRLIAADRELRSPAQPDMDAAWATYQSYPIDYFEDSDDEHRKAVEAAVRAALRSSEATRVGEQGEKENGNV